MKKLLQKLDIYPDKTDIKALLYGFIILNFAGLYHTLNFMWGNHDVKFIKEKLLLSSGLFEGRFTQFIPHSLLTDGQILPLLNNLLGFAFLTLALWLLAKYWGVTKSALNYTLFIAFTATQPYTLSWLYFTFITISCLLWVLFAVLGLFLSEKISRFTGTTRLALSLAAILCFYLPLGGYPPVINTFFVCLCARLVFSFLFEQKDFNTLFQIHKFTLLNIFLAAVLFKITLKFINPNNVYNLEITPFSTLPIKLLSCLKIVVSQFFVAVPFMERSYKLFLFAMSITAFAGAVIKAPKGIRRLAVIGLIACTILASALTTLLVVPHTEFVSRIDFYGFAFIYAFALALLLKFKQPAAQSIALVFMLILIPWNILNDFRAQKIWKQGFTAEFQILDRITERIETHPLFDTQKKYRFYQAGDISLRPSYYRGKYDKDDVFLLSLPYLAIWQGTELMEFYSPFSYIDRNLPLLPEDITPEVYAFFTQKARPWPHKNAVYINNDIIIVILNQAGLDDFIQKIRQIYPHSIPR